MTQTPTGLDDFEFDRNGFLLLRGALSDDEVVRLNVAFDRFPELQTGDWINNAQRRDYTLDTGFELHNALDCGDPAFDMLIDHPGWIALARHYAGEEGSYVEGVTIDENIASIRGAGGHHPVHSGGHDVPLRTMYRCEGGRFRCGQVNVIVALTDIGPGDGATMVIPGTHKSNLAHPMAGDYAAGDRMDALPGAIEVHMRAGDALLFTDALMHGGSSRSTVEGERRVMILRYGPGWGRSRFGYDWSPELLDRLSAERRHIIQPVPPIASGSRRIPREAPHQLIPAG